MNYLVIFLGGFLGAVSRYLFQTYLNKILPQGIIPLSIFTINLIGSFVLGLIIPIKEWVDLSWQLFIMTGFLGAFTTFSTFSLESVLLIEKYGYMKSFIYITISIMSCLFGFYIGNVVSMSL